MSGSKGRQRRRRRCCRRRRRGRCCSTHGCQARGDSGNCLSRRQVRRFSDLHPNRSRSDRREGNRRLMSARCSCEQRGHRSGRYCRACSHRHHALLHRFSLTRNGRRRCRRGQEQLTVRSMRIRIDRTVRTRRRGRKCSGRSSMSSCSCMRNS